MKLLPHYFKWIGISLIILGFIFGIDDFISGFMDGLTEKPFTLPEKMLPAIYSQISDYFLLAGLLVIILSKGKKEDEYSLKLRYESAFIVLIFFILIIMIVYAFNPDFSIKPGIFILLQMLAYLIVRSVKGSTIFWVDYEEQS